MYIPIFAIPLAATWVTVAEGTPKLDVTQSCRGAAQAGYIDQSKDRLQVCLDSEQRKRAELDKSWSTFPAADRGYCVGAMKGFAPTYTELATCLEMLRDVKKIRANATDAMPAAPTMSRPRGSPAGRRP